MARAGNLDGEAHLPRHPEHTMALIELVDLNVMWNEYGLEGDVVVRILFSYYHVDTICFSGIHRRLSPCRHSRITGTRHPTSTYQRDIQGSLGNLGK